MDRYVGLCYAECGVTFAEQVCEAGASVKDTFDQLEFVVVSFDKSRAVRKGYLYKKESLLAGVS